MTPREETPTFDSMFWWFEEFADGVTKAVQEAAREFGEGIGTRVRERVERTRLFYQLLREAIRDPQGFLEEYGNYYNEDGDWIGPQESKNTDGIVIEVDGSAGLITALFLGIHKLAAALGLVISGTVKANLVPLDENSTEDSNDYDLLRARVSFPADGFLWTVQVIVGQVGNILRYISDELEKRNARDNRLDLLYGLSKDAKGRMQEGDDAGGVWYENIGDFITFFAGGITAGVNLIVDLFSVVTRLSKALATGPFSKLLTVLIPITSLKGKKIK